MLSPAATNSEDDCSGIRPERTSTDGRRPAQELGTPFPQRLPRLLALGLGRVRVHRSALLGTLVDAEYAAGALADLRAGRAEELRRLLPRGRRLDHPRTSVPGRLRGPAGAPPVGGGRDSRQA